MENKKYLKDISFIGINILIITLLHYFTISIRWDIHDFYRRLYYIPIILGAFKFRLKGGVITPLIISILYAPHLFVYFGKIDIAILNQFLEIVMFLVVGTVTGFLVESDYSKKIMLELQIRKLTDLENYTQNILDSITNVLVAVDRNFKITSINKEGRRLLNLDDSHIGKGINELFVEYEKVEEKLQDVLAYGKKVLNVETKCYSQNGTMIYVRFLAYPLRNIMNHIEGVVIVLEDISEIINLEKQVRRAEKLSAVGELASGVAHEIRNPMGIIKTISQTLYEEVEDHNIQEGIEIIIHEIDRANAVIKGLLDFARPGIHQEGFVSMDQMIRNIILITKKYAEQHHVKINYESKGDQKTWLDSEKIKQAFINIIFNAVQAMPKGGILKIKLDNRDHWIQIQFIDTGIGIPKEKQEKIFEPFYTTKNSGTGLGLAITHRIIEEHKGYIKIDSEVENGTNISIYLPVIQEVGENDDQKNINS